MYKEMLDLIAYGFLAREIAEMYDISIHDVYSLNVKCKEEYKKARAICKARKQKRVEERTKEWVQLYNQGLKEHEIGKMYNIAPSYVSLCISKYITPNYLHGDKNNKVYVDLYNKGKSLINIAKQFNRSRNYIKNRVEYYSKVRPRFSYDDIDHEWVDLYKYGYSCREIAKIYGTSHRTVAGHVSKKCEFKKNSYAHLVDEWINLYEQGYTQAQIADKYGVSRSVINKYFSLVGIVSFNLKFDYMMPTFIELYNKGYSFKDIQDETGICRTTIHKYFKLYGIESRSYKESCKHKIKLRDDFFNVIDSDLKAFLLGIVTVFTTFPRLTHTSRYRMISSCSKQNKKYLDLLQKHLILEEGIDFAIWKDDRCVLYLSSEELYTTLDNNYNLSNKIDKAILPQLTKSQFQHYISALFTVRIKPLKSGEYIYWGNETYIRDMQSSLLKFFNIKSTIEATDSEYNGTKLYRIIIKPNDLQTIYNGIEYI